MSWSSARTGGSARTSRTASWSRSAIRVRRGRRGGGSLSPSGGGVGEHGRRTRPWIPEPGLWMQWDYGDGPTVDGRSTVLFCAWLAWSRYRVVVPLRDKTLPSVVMGLDRALRTVRGLPDVCVDRQRADGERSITCAGSRSATRRSSGGPALRADDRDVRARGSTDQGRLGGDGPDREGGSGADRSQPPRRSTRSFAELEAACEELMAEVNTRPHRSTHGAAGDPAGGGARAAAPAPAAAAHGLLRGDPEGQLAVDDQRRRRAVLGPARADRRAGVGPHRRRSS